MTAPSSTSLHLMLRRAAAAAAATTTTTTTTSPATWRLASAPVSTSRALPCTAGASPTHALRQYHHHVAAGGQDKEKRQQQQPAALIGGLRRRCLSSTAASGEGNDGASNQQPPQQQQDEQTAVVYRGALGPSLRRLKLVSLANTAVALAASPTLSWLAEAAPDGTTAAAYARAATVAATAAGFGVLTTLGLHWFTKPYVHEIVRLGNAHNYRLRALSPLARAVWRPLDVSAVRAADVARPLATFVEGGRVYYVEPAGFSEGEDALREALTPMSAAELAAVEQARRAAAEAEEEEQQQQVGQQQHGVHQQEGEESGRR